MHFAICRWVYAIGLSLCVSASAQHAPETTIEIDATKTASYTIPRTIFGTFLEPIGNSIYNGLWAELLQNPSFEDNLWDVKHVAEMVKADPELNRASEMGLPLPWEPLRYDQGSRYAPRWNSTESLSSCPTNFPLRRKRLCEACKRPGKS